MCRCAARSATGRRFKKEVLAVKYRGADVSSVLDMTIEEALELFQDVPAVADRLKLMVEVGLGYLQLGQPATTLSGGEAQRVKLAKELARGGSGRTLYLLDEPTTGLHPADVARLLALLQRLVAAGNSVVVVEHHLEVIGAADWIIDLGPEGGMAGGQLVAQGTPDAGGADGRLAHRRVPGESSLVRGAADDRQFFITARGLFAGSEKIAQSPCRYAEAIATVGEKAGCFLDSVPY